jgi:hypothetical protein
VTLADHVKVRISLSVPLSARTFARVSSGIFAKASLVGAKTVRASELLRVSARPASVTAAASVESTGLLEAAVATGLVAMPVKAPGPAAGISAQARPKAPAPGSLGAPVESIVVSLACVASSLIGGFCHTADPYAEPRAGTAWFPCLARRMSSRPAPVVEF